MHAYAIDAGAALSTRILLRVLCVITEGPVGTEIYGIKLGVTRIAFVDKEMEGNKREDAGER